MWKKGHLISERRKVLMPRRNTLSIITILENKATKNVNKFFRKKLKHLEIYDLNDLEFRTAVLKTLRMVLFCFLNVAEYSIFQVQ